MSEPKPVKQKKVETIRERAERAMRESKEPKSKETETAKVKTKRLLVFKKRPAKVKKERRFHIIPKFFRESWSELRQVTWPNRRDTFRLTLAVILFSVVFGALVGGVDYGLGIVFKRVFLHG